MYRSVSLNLLALLSLLGASALISACNTVAGAGADVQQAGQAIKTEANENRH